MGEPVVFTMSDLEACYDSQLPNMGGKVEESIGVNRKAIKIVNKVLPWCKHLLGIDHDLSKDSYEEINEWLGKIGQKNTFSGSACRDVSFFLCK